MTNLFGFPLPCYTWDCIQQDLTDHPYVVIGAVLVIVFLAWRRPSIRT